jgi:D-psicose/D-tagatose/L-ribulose 3-epimerase
MNRIGVHAMVWVGGWSRAECRLAISSAAEAGFDLIEIPLLDPRAVDPVDTRRVLDEHGIAATCSLGLSHATDISTGDPDKIAAGRALLLDALEVTNELGATYLSGVLFGALGRYDAPPTVRGRAASIEIIRELCDVGADHGVTIGLEAVNRYESNMINTAEQALAFADAVGAPNCTVHLDSYHMNIEELDLASPIERSAGRIGGIHLGESHRGGLGTGTIDFRQLFGALARTSYPGPITFESFSIGAVAPGLGSALCIWREMWDDGMALATAAREFVEAQLAVRRA